MFEKLEHCPSCGHPKFINHLIARDHLVTGESFALTKCASCELIITNPRPTQESIGKYYDSAAYLSHHKSYNPMGLAYSIAKYFTLRWKLSILKKYLTHPETLLDFGCGTGDFLSVARKKGWSVTGLERDDHARGQAQTKLKNKVLSNIDQIDKTFDIITLWHVLEHLHDLKPILKTLTRKLTPKGYLVIALPNIDSFDSQHYQQHWAGLDVPRHLYHFTPLTFKRLVKTLQLHEVAVIPMKLDAFYVSLLSEKNITGGSFINAFKTARKSNAQANQSGQYSSLIYILRK